MKSVGIDIGTASIKVVEVTQSNRGLFISKYMEQALGQSPGFDSEVQILEFLRTLSESYDPASTKFVFGLRQDRVAVRLKTFPFTDRQKILKALPFELEEDLPFSPETAIYDFKLIRTVGNTSEVLAAAAPKHRIQAAVQLMQDGGFEVDILSAEGLALANCFESWDAAPPAKAAGQVSLENSSQRKIQVRLHLGHTRSLVLAFEENSLVGLRSVAWGGRNIADSIAKKYEIPFIEALKEMQTKAFLLPNKEGASYDQIVFADTIANSVRELSRELKITFLELQSELSAEITSVETFGGVSGVLNLHTGLTQFLELPVNKGSFLSAFQGNFERSPQTEAVIGVALGLAIEGLKKPRNPAVSFLKAEFAKQNHALKKFWEDWGPYVQTGAALFVLFFIYASLRESFALQMADQANEVLKTQARSVAGLTARNANEAGVKKYIRDQRKKATEMQKVVSYAQMNSALDVLRKLSDNAPAKNLAKLNVKRVSIEDQVLIVEGSASTMQETVALEKALSNAAIGGKVERLNPTVTALPNQVAFAFRFNVDRGVK
ncbi:MAG: pilus assembly protein PilM [Proteobacteria bacterium]|jgi:general secretion pathway protein L|nr:pilus assembly protein PilM [Pseudomonadota bacterium]